MGGHGEIDFSVAGRHGNRLITMGSAINTAGRSKKMYWTLRGVDPFKNCGTVTICIHDTLLNRFYHG